MPEPAVADLSLAALFAGWAIADEVQRRIAADGLDDLRFADGVVFQHLVPGPDDRRARGAARRQPAGGVEGGRRPRASRLRPARGGPGRRPRAPGRADRPRRGRDRGRPPPPRRDRGRAARERLGAERSRPRGRRSLEALDGSAAAPPCAGGAYGLPPDRFHAAPLRDPPIVAAKAAMAAVLGGDDRVPPGHRRGGLPRAATEADRDSRARTRTKTGQIYLLIAPGRQRGPPRFHASPPRRGWRRLVARRQADPLLLGRGATACTCSSSASAAASAQVTRGKDTYTGRDLVAGRAPDRRHPQSLGRGRDALRLAGGDARRRPAQAGPLHRWRPALVLASVVVAERRVDRVRAHRHRHQRRRSEHLHGARQQAESRCWSPTPARRPIPTGRPTAA